MRKIIKKIEQDKHIMMVPAVCGKIVSGLPASGSRYVLSFTDGTKMIIGTLDCDGQNLKEGDKIFAYGDLLSRKLLSSQEISRRKKQERNAERRMFACVGIFIVAMTVLLATLF